MTKSRSPRATTPLARAHRAALDALRIAERLQRGKTVPRAERIRGRLAFYAECGVREDEAHRRNLRALREDVEHLERAMVAITTMTPIRPRTSASTRRSRPRARRRTARVAAARLARGPDDDDPARAARSAQGDRDGGWW